MPSRSVTLHLDGAPTVGDYAAALSALQELLAAISARVARGVQIDWVIANLKVGSAITTAQGEADDAAAVEKATEEFLNTGHAMREALAVPDTYRPAVVRLKSILNGRVPLLRFETADDDVTIPPDAVQDVPVPSQPTEPTPMLGAIEGRVQTLSSRGSLRFTLYDLAFDKAVSCYLAPGQESLMLDAWGRIAVVEGTVKREAKYGRPLTIRQVSRVHVKPEAEPFAWRAARGALQGFGDEPAEVTIRRIRDAQ